MSVSVFVSVFVFVAYELLGEIELREDCGEEEEEEVLSE